MSELTQEDAEAVAMHAKAMAAYTLLGYDPLEFIDYVKELDMPTRTFLMGLFITPNPNMSQSNKELNEIGASLLKQYIEDKPNE